MDGQASYENSIIHSLNGTELMIEHVRDDFSATYSRFMTKSRTSTEGNVMWKNRVEMK